MSTESLNDTMNLVRHLASHLAAEPNLPSVRELTRGEVDAWIRALDVDIEPRAVDFLSVPVLELLLHKQNLGIWDNPRCLARAPIANFNPVAVNPWNADATFYIDHVVKSGGSPLDASVAAGVETITIEDDASEDDSDDESMTDFNPGETAITSIRDAAEAEVSEQNINDDGNSGPEDTEGEITVRGSAEKAYLALKKPERNHRQTNSRQGEIDDDEGDDEDLDGETAIDEAEDPAEISMQQEPEPQDPENADSSSTAEESDDDYPDRELWCHCNMPQDERSMVECNNHKDVDCKGKWYHISCAGLSRVPPEKSDWYCRDCRKKRNPIHLNNEPRRPCNGDLCSSTLQRWLGALDTGIPDKEIRFLAPIVMCQMVTHT
ncbi:hypothetical protein D6C77_02594 [Aureobasidium pullulans]|nr:hypothetical protein D6C77_02594 [Aureobasidium pullulans]